MEVKTWGFHATFHLRHILETVLFHICMKHVSTSSAVMNFFSVSSNHTPTYFYVVLASITNNTVEDVLFYILTCNQPLSGAHFGCRRMSSSSPGISSYISSVVPCCCNDMVLVLLWNSTKFYWLTDCTLFCRGRRYRYEGCETRQ